MPGRVEVHDGVRSQWWIRTCLVFPLLLSAVCLWSRQEMEIYVKTGVTVLSSYITVVTEYLVANTSSFRLFYALVFRCNKRLCYKSYMHLHPLPAMKDILNSALGKETKNNTQHTTFSRFWKFQHFKVVSTFSISSLFGASKTHLILSCLFMQVELCVRYFPSVLGFSPR